ncbi:hypothetical protein J6590_079270 [Homalodisca vitripennis]|nr:hypothetical protein J6590_079270 [Homalodisca vitripennis]
MQSWNLQDNPGATDTINKVPFRCQQLLRFRYFRARLLFIIHILMPPPTHENRSQPYAMVPRWSEYELDPRSGRCKAYVETLEEKIVKKRNERRQDCRRTKLCPTGISLDTKGDAECRTVVHEICRPVSVSCARELESSVGQLYTRIVDQCRSVVHGN